MKLADPNDLILEDEFQRNTIKLAETFGWTVWWTYDSKHSPEGEFDLRMARADDNGGRYIAAEMKTQGGHLSKEQKKTLALLEQIVGVEAYVWKPADRDKIETILR